MYWIPWWVPSVPRGSHPWPSYKATTSFGGGIAWFGWSSTSKWSTFSLMSSTSKESHFSSMCYFASMGSISSSRWSSSPQGPNSTSRGSNATTRRTTFRGYISPRGFKQRSLLYDEETLIGYEKWQGCPIVKFGVLPSPPPTMINLIKTETKKIKFEQMDLHRHVKEI